MVGVKAPERAPTISDEGDNLAKIRVEDITSLTNFHRNSTMHCKRLKKSGRPEVLTVNGKAVLVVQDAEAYQQLLEAVERAGEVLSEK
jgi:PHD/YefM family antitoxin component YafN of YafNO toxin-antitoxin module